VLLCFQGFNAVNKEILDDCHDELPLIIGAVCFKLWLVKPKRTATGSDFVIDSFSI
jgi:hypothetical protein